jgi:sulfate-transporting ATPase
MILKREVPDGGDFTVGSTVKVAVVDQGREGLDNSRSVYEEITG